MLLATAAGLGGAALFERPDAHDGAAFDERIEDGLYCASAMQTLKALVEDPEWMKAPQAEGQPRAA